MPRRSPRHPGKRARKRVCLDCPRLIWMLGNRLRCDPCGTERYLVTHRASALRSAAKKRLAKETTHGR